MSEVTGTPMLSGPEADAHSADYELLWAEELDERGVYPADVRPPLAELLSA